MIQVLPEAERLGIDSKEHRLGCKGLQKTNRLPVETSSIPIGSVQSFCRTDFFPLLTNYIDDVPLSGDHCILIKFVATFAI